MASRQEEKEQRKREREERERAAAKDAKRKRLLQVIGGVAIGAVVVIAVVLVIAGGGGGDKADQGDLRNLAAAAGCTVREFPSEGQEHVTKKLTAADYKTNPPTSGDHAPPDQVAQDGLYATGNEPDIGRWVHTLEHGRIIFQYKPGTSKTTISKLMELYNRPVLDSPAGYHSVLMQNNSKMPFEVAAVAWQAYIGCEKFTPAAIPALDSFREVFVDTAPEQIP